MRELIEIVIAVIAVFVLAITCICMWGAAIVKHIEYTDNEEETL